MSAKNEVLSVEETAVKKASRVRFIVCMLGVMFAVCGMSYGLTAVLNVKNMMFFPYLHATILCFIGSAIFWMTQYIVDTIKQKDISNG